MDAMAKIDLSFYNKKRIFLTGCTGFKGSWLCHLLLCLGADVYGYALEPPTSPSLFELTGLEKKIHFVNGDIRDLESLCKAVDMAKPDIVIHMAAQPIVRESYKNPVYTYETNVIGTVNILEAIRKNGFVKSFLNITTDKVYRNNEWVWGYRENDRLGGFDPYSNSKACSEMVTQCYRDSFLNNSGCAVSTARAGNVIGGGDFAADRIIPDCVRAASHNEPIPVRNPYSVRPYQHVLDPLYAYLLIAAAQYNNKKYADSYNVGPDEIDCVTTGKLVDLFCKAWGNGLMWENKEIDGPHEAGLLKLDCSKLKTAFDWKPCWKIEKAIEKTVEWTKAYLEHKDLSEYMANQINEFLFFQGGFE